MKKQTILAIALILTLILAACSKVAELEGQQMDSPQSNAQTDSELSLTPDPLDNPMESPQGPVYIDSYDILAGGATDSIVIKISGSLPTSCSQLKFQANTSMDSAKIMVSVYSVEPEGQVCAQVLTPFEEAVTVPGLHTGNYDLFINNELKETVPLPLITAIHQG